VAATVGLILRVIESNSEKVGRFVAGLLGMATLAKRTTAAAATTEIPPVAEAE
jgi:hypothetical protein